MKLFDKTTLDGFELSNRLVMAPMTRSRAVGSGNIPSPLAPTYYAQRATAGLIVTEGTQVSPRGQGYIRTPGIHSAEQVAGWRKVTEAVHAAGGRIYAQLWHVGRVSHPDFHGGELPVGPSAIAAEGEVYTSQGRKQMVAPRALETSEIPGIIEEFRGGAENAKTAGFDGVEIHGANGYLLDQFLRDGSNHRSDRYGGSLQNRARLGIEVAEAVSGVWGASRVGYRVSPYNFFNGMSDSNPVETFSYLARELDRLGLGYLHNFEAVAGPGAPPATVTRTTPILRKIFRGAYIVNGGYDARSANEAIEGGVADLVAFGVPFLANPDLVERYRTGSPLNAPDHSTFYSGEEKGYVDYPTLGA